jgi:hypothetical protein
MAQRRYGPTRGAGVTVIELEGEKGIEPGALGWCGYAGIMEKGPVGELIIAPNKSTFVKKCGGIIDDSLLPDAALDYYSLANGAGGLALVRVTDGNEVQAEMTLYARYESLLTPMGTLKAKNGGRWGGKENYHTGVATGVTETTVTTGVTMLLDEWAGGYLQISGSTNTYEIISNTAAGVITVAADSTIEFDGGAVDDVYYLYHENAGKAVSIMIGDGEEKPDTEFSISVYVDGAFVKKYGNLSTNPSDSRYWVSLINNDDGNDEIEAVDLWTGAHTAAVRPANKYGIIDTAGITDTVLTSVIYDLTVTTGDATPTLTLGTTTDSHLAQKLTITMTAADTGNVVSDKFGAVGTITVDSVYDNTDYKWVPPFTIADGGTTLEATDVIVINYKPFVLDSLIGGYLYPDKVNASSTRYRIVDNDHKTITVADGSDMTSVAAAADKYMVVAPLEMSGGKDGNASVDSTSYSQQAWDVDNSPFNRLFGKNMGLIKYATPGVTTTAVQKAGVAYAEAKNHQYRYEITSDTVTEAGAITYINDTLGRSDFAVVAFPSYGTVPDPLSNEGKTKTVTLTGMIHGREARIAADYDGYHKAEAGIDAKLPKLLDIPTSDAILNEELLNPAGIAIIKKVKGNFIIWGDRTVHSDPTWKWKHQRETMSYYEHVLQESFDWIVFMINDRITESLAISALNSFFLPEYAKRAVRGNTFKDAVVIKLDEELNTDATRANGDMISEIKLRLADTVERFIIRIGKQGIFESVG